MSMEHVRRLLAELDAGGAGGGSADPKRENPETA